MPTIFDRLHFELFGKECTREGEAFEKISAAVTYLLFPSSNVAHNQMWRGVVSKSLYQVDILRTEDDQKIFGEAKDYTARRKASSKVGRGDLQKLGGALPDVKADRGVFFSATDYTREARRYANAASGIIGRPIDLMHIRPSVDLDKEGRIQKIVLNLTVRNADIDNIKWRPILAPAGEAAMQRVLAASGLEELRTGFILETLVDSHGDKICSISDLTAGGFGDSAVDEEAHACFWLPLHFVKFEGELVEIRGLEYLVRYHTEKMTVEIVSDGEPRILVKSDDGSVNRLVTDQQLRDLSFDTDGNVLEKP